MAVETHYWKKVQDNYRVSDYQEVDDDEVVFPPIIDVTYTVCSTECGERQWTSGGSPVCHRCGNLMFGTVSRWYKLMPADFEPTEEERSQLYTVWRPEEPAVSSLEKDGKT